MIAITCILAGLYVVLRPFLAWGLLIFVVIGAILLTGFAHVFSPGPWWARVLPAAAAVGVVATILIYPGMTISLLVLLAAASLIITALSRMIGAVRGRHGDRYASMVSGLAALLLAVTALAWPDATVFLVATIFGVYLVLFGVELLVHVWRGARSDRDSSTAASIVPSRGARVRTGVAASLALVGSIALVAGGLALSGTPQPDGFYTPPDGLPPQAGVLLSAQVFTRDVPAGAEGWRILYTTTNGDDEIITASGLVIAPADATRSPVIAWAHGTTGFARGCAPSLLEHPFVAGGMPATEDALAAGWSIVATDYPGLGTTGVQPYLIGQGEGRAVLDAVRAARQLESISLAEETVIWGHSQGGHASLWAGGLASTYAPELTISGVAAMAPASDLPVLLEAIADQPVGSVFGSFALAAYAGTYDDVATTDYVRPGAHIMMQEMQSRCLTDASSLVSIATALSADASVWAQSPGDGALGEHAERYVPRLLISAPVFLAQGLTDTLVVPAMQQGYVSERCAAGQVIDYREYPDADHMGLVADQTLLDDLMSWTTDRFAGQSAATECARG
ncbi:hypothetical protein GCM10009860_17130 [Microbacterium mitrae]